ncbi:MAG: UbiA family prenyltransferase [Bacteroidia bacterium]|nr:UbiA family prenyltransferase [Bacteroidia bacterium]
MIKSNIFIALAAVFLAIETQIQLGMNPQWHPYLFIIFFATLFEYNLHRFITVVTNKQALNNEKHHWVKEHLILFYIVVALSAIGFIISLFLAQKAVLIALAPIGLLTLFYSFPVVKFFRLREVPGLKVFMIAFIWSALTVLLPLIHTPISFSKVQGTIILIERFLFILAITIPFDIRDMEGDKQYGLKTIPLLIGEQKSITFANSSIVLFVIISTIHYLKTGSTGILFAFIISAFSTLLFLNNKKIRLLPYYHYGILDGTMLLQGLLVYLFYFIEINI